VVLTPVSDEVLEKKLLPLDPDLETTVAIIDKVSPAL
jgi:hypothetical protein